MALNGLLSLLVVPMTVKPLDRYYPMRYNESKFIRSSQNQIAAPKADQKREDNKTEGQTER